MQSNTPLLAPRRTSRSRRHRAGDRAPHRAPPRWRGVGGRQVESRGHDLPELQERPGAVVQTKRILLVEDNPKDIELTLAALEHHRLANGVVVARDGVEALDYLRCTGKFTGRDPDLPVLVLLDLKMPKMDGLEVLRAVKQDPVLRSV